VKLLSLFSKFRREVKLHIRKAEERDLSILSQIHHESFKHGWSDGELGKLISNDIYTCLIAQERTSQPIGFILYRNIVDEAEIITIAIAKSARRKGIGEKLLETSIRNLQFARVTKYFLEVDETNQSAINLYKKFNFRPVGKRQGYYAPANTSDEKRPAALVMERQLS